MTQRSYTFIAGLIFLLIALGHLVRIAFRLSFEVDGIAVPMWASLVAAILLGFLSYEGFHIARKLPPRT